MAQLELVQLEGNDQPAPTEEIERVQMIERLRAEGKINAEAAGAFIRRGTPLKAVLTFACMPRRHAMAS